MAPESLPEISRELAQLLRATLAGQPPEPVTNWDALLQQARWHGVDAFLFPTIAALPADRQPPQAVLTQWRLQALTAAVAAVHREAQTRELLSAMAEARVCVVPLKGAWLAMHAYPESGQRPMADIDILTPPQDLAQARKVLATLGYECRGKTASLELDCDQTYTCARHAWPLELHWRLGVSVNPPLHQPETPGLWKRLVPETLLDAPVHTLCLEEHLVLLAYHVLHHRFMLPLRSYLDIVLLGRLLDDPARRAPLREIAAEWGMTAALPRVVAIAYDLFDQKLPGMIASQTPDTEKPARAQALRTILMSGTQRTLPMEQTLLAFRKQGRLARIGLLLKRICMPREFLRREYACARWRIGLPLAYLLRALDLLRRNSGVIRNTLRHDPAVTRQLDHAAARAALLHWALTGRDAAATRVRKR